jgi:hypothetical protein
MSGQERLTPVPANYFEDEFLSGPTDPAEDAETDDECGKQEVPVMRSDRVLVAPDSGGVAGIRSRKSSSEHQRELAVFPSPAPESRGRKIRDESATPFQVIDRGPPRQVFVTRPGPSAERV